MRGDVARARFAAVALLLGAFAACRSSDTATGSRSAAEQTTAAPPEAQALPVSLPDISSLDETVQEQIRERYSSLQRMQLGATAGDVDLSDAYGELGKLLMAVEYLNAAEPCFFNAQTLAPGDLRWSYYLGHLYKAKGEVAKSKASFERVLQLRPDDVATLIWLGEAHLGDGHPEAAEPLFVKALSLQSRSVPALYGLGRAALAREDYRTAVKHLEQALMLDERAVGLHYPLAMAYRGLGETSKADVHFRQRGESNLAPADPLMEQLKELLQSPLAYEMRGTRALNSQNWAAAIQNFRKGLELAPENPTLRHKLGTALFLMGDASAAQTEFERVVRTSPQYAKAHYSLGVIMETNGRIQEAMERFSAAVKYDPSYVEARVRLAGLLRRSGRLQESLRQYTRVLEINPRIPEALFGYSMALVRLRRFEEALQKLSDASKVHPDQVGFAHARARLLAAAPDDRVRDGRQAMSIMQALSDEQRRMDLGETMAMTLAELGQYEEAAALQRGAVAAARQAGQPGLAERMGGNLRLYEAHKPCRTPWRDQDLP